ncbi:unnamed protein product, partial [Laminaria digitata]
LGHHPHHHAERYLVEHRRSIKGDAVVLVVEDHRASEPLFLLEEADVLPELRVFHHVYAQRYEQLADVI